MPFYKVMLDDGSTVHERLRLEALPTSGDQIEFDDVAYPIVAVIHHAVRRDAEPQSGLLVPIVATIVISSNPQMCIKWPPLS